MSKWPEKILQESNYASNIIKEAYLKQCTEYFIWIEKINAVIDACRAAANSEILEELKTVKGKLALSAYHSGTQIDLSWIDYRISEIEKRKT